MKKIVFYCFLLIALLLLSGCSKERKLDFNCPELKGQTIKQATKKFLLTDSGNLYYFNTEYNYYDSKKDFSLFSNNSNCIKLNENIIIEKIVIIAGEERYAFFIDNNQKYYLPILNDTETAFESIFSMDKIVNDFKNMSDAELGGEYDGFEVTSPEGEINRYDNYGVEFIKKYMVLQFLKDEGILVSDSIYIPYQYNDSVRVLYIKNNDIYRVIVEEDEKDSQLSINKPANKGIVTLNSYEKPVMRLLDTQYNIQSYIEQSYKIESNKIYFDLNELLAPDEHVIDMIKGETNLYYIRTDQSFYLLNVHAVKNGEECKKYTDVKCEYGITATKLEYASEKHDLYVYVSKYLFITKDGIFILKNFEF